MVFVLRSRDVVLLRGSIVCCEGVLVGGFSLG